MPGLHVPPELKSCIIKAVVFDYLWDTLNSSAPEEDLKLGGHVMSLLQSSTQLRAMTMKHLERALGAETVSEQGVSRIVPSPWSIIAPLRSLTQWRGSLHELCSILKAVKKRPIAPLMWIYAYEAVVLRLVGLGMPPKGSFTSVNIWEIQDTISDPLLDIGTRCYEESMRHEDWYDDKISGLMLSLKMHLLWLLDRALSRSAVVSKSHEKVQREVLDGSEPMSAIVEQEELIGACMDVLEGASNALQRVFPHEDWELFIDWKFAERIPAVLKVLAKLQWQNRTTQDYRQRANRLLDFVNSQAKRLFPQTHGSFFSSSD